MVYTRVDTGDSATCCSNYCTYSDGSTGNYLQYISMMGNYVVSSTTPCFTYGSFSYSASYSHYQVAAGCSSDDEIAFTDRLIATSADGALSV